MKNLLLIIALIIFINTILFSQAESFVLINSSGDTVFVVKEDGTALLKGEVIGSPIGTLDAFFKDLTGTPLLPSGWVECNGLIINDPGSPYRGIQTPDLNGAGSTKRSLWGAKNSGFLGAGLHNHKIYNDDPASSGNLVGFMMNSQSYTNQHTRRGYDGAGNFISFSRTGGNNLLDSDYFTSNSEANLFYYEVV